MNTTNTTMPSHDDLMDLGEVIATAYEGTCYLYSYLGTNYVVLPENSVMTQEEDNNNGPEEAIFPYSF